MDYTVENISHFFLLLTAVMALVFYKKYKHTPIKYLPYYLWYAAILEIGAKYLYPVFGLTNVWWYNIGINIEILFYLFLYFQYTNKKNTKRLILFGSIIYEIYYFVNLLSFSDWNTYQTYPFTLGGILIIGVIFMFLVEMFQSDKILYFYKYPIFWISVGLLFYNIIPLPLFVVRNIISQDTFNYVYPLAMGIQYTANILMYVSFIYGFIGGTMSYKSNYNNSINDNTELKPNKY